MPFAPFLQNPAHRDLMIKKMGDDSLIEKTELCVAENAIANKSALPAVVVSRVGMGISHFELNRKINPLIRESNCQMAVFL